MNKTITNYFSGRTLVIATMHGKEKILKPLFEQSLGVNVMIPAGFNTDDFGTFTGEIERTTSPLETARNKCRAAGELTGEPLVLASEGSFGAHPVMGFVPTNEELLVLQDRKAGVEFKAKVITTQTNYAANDYYHWEDVLFFASAAGFPSHGLIVRADRNDCSEIHKGIRHWEKLKESFAHFQRKNGKAFVETDMRAHHNPTRMKTIREVAEKLLAVIGSECPLCSGPGFAVKDVVRGLPCSRCDTPTQTAKANVYYCQHCGHSEVRPFPEKKKQEDPAFCEVCNP